MSDERKVIAQVGAQHPFPWQQIALPGGLLKLIDAAGREVDIFAITGLCVAITHHLVRDKEPAAA